MKKERTIIGVDLGGTNMRAGLVADNRILKHAQRRVPKTDNPEDVISELKAVIDEVMTTEVSAIGIGVPSLVGTKSGIVYDVQNIPSWVEVPLKDILWSHFDMPVYINNDANCFAVGERVFGDGAQFDDFVGLITGTGMGAGIIKSGHLVQDQNCGAGEFGMIPYLNHNYEYYCSGQFFTNTYGIEGHEMARRANQGNSDAILAFEAYGHHLGMGIKTIMYTVDPQAVIIGGSLSKSYHLYEKAMWEEIKSFPYSISLKNFKIMPSKMEEISIFGAAALCINNLDIQ